MTTSIEGNDHYDAQVLHTPLSVGMREARKRTLVDLNINQAALLIEVDTYANGLPSTLDDEQANTRALDVLFCAGVTLNFSYTTEHALRLDDLI